MKKFISIATEFVDLIVLTITAPLYIFGIGILSILTDYGIAGTVYAWAPSSGFIAFRTYSDGTNDQYVINYSTIFKRH